MDLTDLTLDESVSGIVDISQDNITHAREERTNALEALKYIDDHWYKEIAGKKARWMDLIGDYAGNERFILDGDEHLFVCEGWFNNTLFTGESLLQHVLDDPLLALARTGGGFIYRMRFCVGLRSFVIL